jgi:hypothetical protein
LDAHPLPRSLNHGIDSRDHLTEEHHLVVSREPVKLPIGRLLCQPWVRVPVLPPNLLKTGHSVRPEPDSQGNYTFFGCLRGRFQYGLLHFGHTLGSPMVPRRGIHSCPQRRHRNPCLVMVVRPIPTKPYTGRNTLVKVIL